ncbi:glutaredoxin [Pseudorhodobacter turbinis]|uniref:Glutaredoxin n=1 Tax=Pseudorhodobacter turbinis TaxID=2500533 RepID=A0A4P8ECM9_9RHOB|nr:glutaredoxin [Pseudorhodobacter turbinis]QCO54640.1 glutaredoxin [Pseudorhodobacter turbinis]
MRPLLSPDAIHPAIKETVSAYHSDIVQEVIQAVAADGVVVVGMKQNPIVKKARKSLQVAGIEFTYLEYGSYTSQWHKRLALKMWSGWATFPMIFVDQMLIGGNAELQALLKDPDAQSSSLKRI